MLALMCRHRLYPDRNLQDELYHPQAWLADVSPAFRIILPIRSAIFFPGIGRRTNSPPRPPSPPKRSAAHHRARLGCWSDAYGGPSNGAVPGPQPGSRTWLGWRCPRSLRTHRCGAYFNWQKVRRIDTAEMAMCFAPLNMFLFAKFPGTGTSLTSCQNGAYRKGPH